jgi:hypothetical protein
MPLAVDSAPHCERDDDPENCGIEITPEMIDAGCNEFALFESGDSHYSIVKAIYLVMEIARRLSS